MKKTAVILVSAVLFSVFSLSVYANVVTTAPQESTASTTADGYEAGLVREVDITAPITACVIAVCSLIAYGAVKIRKTAKDNDIEK